MRLTVSSKHWLHTSQCMNLDEHPAFSWLVCLLKSCGARRNLSETPSAEEAKRSSRRRSEVRDMEVSLVEPAVGPGRWKTQKMGLLWCAAGVGIFLGL